MTSTFVNDLRLNEMATGDQSGSWGTVTNTNLELIGDAFGFGTEAITTNNNTHETLIANGAADAGRSMFLRYTGTLDSPCTITISAGASATDFTISKLWFIENATTGGENIIITSGSGADVTIPAGDVKVIYTNGAGSGGAVVDAFASLSVVDLKVQGALTMSGGGDGAVSFSTASSIKILDNNAASLVFEEANNAYMTFVTTNSSEAVRFDKALSLNDGTDNFNIGVTTNKLTIKSTTSDGSDDTSILIDAGAGGESSSRGGYIEVHGNETSADPGKVIYQMGSVSGSTHEFRKAGGNNAVVIDSTGSVGLGTSIPLHVLDIDAVATGAIPTNANMGTSTDNDNYFGFHNTSNSATFSGFSLETRTSGAARWLIANEWKSTYLGDLVFRARSGASASAERLRINVDGKVLIGSATSGRASPFQIHTPASGGGDSILLTRADTNTDQQVGSINFGNNSDSDLGLITAKTIGAANTGAILLSTATTGTTTERMRVGGGGGAQQVFIGKQGTAFNTAGVEVGTSGLWVSRDGGSLSLNQLNSSGGNLIEMYRQGSAVGSIAAVSDDLAIFTPTSGHKGLRFGNGAIVPTNNSGAADNGNCNLGGATSQFNNFFLAGGVVFGPASASNVSSQTLSSYEEGTWTPAIVGSSGKNITDTNYARYVKIGKQVHFQAYIVMDGTGNSVAFRLGGLPYAPPSNGYSVVACDINRVAHGGVYGRVASSSQILDFYFFSGSINSDRSVLLGNDLGTGYFICSGTYIAN